VSGTQVDTTNDRPICLLFTFHVVITFNPLKLQISSCQMRDTFSVMPTMKIVVISIFSVILALMVFATSFDYIISSLKQPNAQPEIIRVQCKLPICELIDESQMIITFLSC